ncbi:hypothetical protein [Bacillus sp. Marseille-P3800]|uniref:hypothetical protein n=1 Tax=Bacillus sp. Marseille-P3800 TaxID=2014782 RepID=UPI0011453413|nr:hypothetical protein [Bacillus sp. Marseille-P3800]
MSSTRLTIYSLSTILFITWVFLHYIDIWSSTRFIEIIFFFTMVISIFTAGYYYSKHKSK